MLLEKDLSGVVLVIVVLLCLLATDSQAYAYVDPSITNNLRNQSEVQIIVVLKGVDRSHALGEKGFNANEETLGSIIRDDVVSNTPRGEFKVKYVSPTGLWFSGYSTIIGLDNLSKNGNVAKIYYNSLVHIGLNDSIPRINADDAWNLSYMGDGQVICVLDTGVNSTHPALIGRILSQYCHCSLGGGCCQGLNISLDSSDDHGHGTHVTGIIISNDTFYRGVAPHAKVVAVKVLNANGDGTFDDLGAGIDWCVYNVSNVSLMSASIWSVGSEYNDSSPCPTYIDGSINRAYARGIPFITITGNDGFTHGISYPGCSPNATAVGATNKDDTIGSITNRYKWLDLLAPGIGITSTRWSSSSCLPGCTCSGNFMTCSGTSMAAPHVAGAAAILKQIKGNLTPDEIEFVLKYTGKPIYDNGTGGTNLTFPRIDVYNATLMILRSVFFDVSNSGTASLNVTNINSSMSWVSSVYPTSFVLPVGYNKTVMVTVDLQDSMPSGSFLADVVVYSNDPDEPVKHVPLLYQHVKPGCTGNCPPASGDWNVTTYTALWTNNTAVTGKINILNSSTLFLGELTANATSELKFTDGELRMDGAAFRFN